MKGEHNDYDFGRCYLYFTTTRVNHTPRLQIDAVCTLCNAGEIRRYFLTCACIAEAMYMPTGLIHDPVAEFNLIVAPRRQFLLLKRHASAHHDVRDAYRFDDVMATHDGKGAQVTNLDVTLASYGQTQQIDTYEEFREALLGNRPINGRTRFTETDGTEVILDYPSRTVNVAHDRAAWQVDAGPIVMPRPTATQPEERAGTDVALEVERLDMAFLVFNSFTYAEAVLRRAPSGEDGLRTGVNFYDLRHNLDCRNELFAAVLP